MNYIEYYMDEYDYYNFDCVVINLSYFWKGRLKKEVSLNINRLNLVGYERKLLMKL